MHLQHSIETNRDHTLIVHKHNSAYRYFSIDFSNENQFGKVLEIYPPLCTYADILDYCHGLVCIHDSWVKEMAIWNPLIRKLKELPSELIEKPEGFADSRYSHFAFGHDPHNNDYKVLRVVTFDNGDQLLKEFEVKVYSLLIKKVKVYSLRTHSWKKNWRSMATKELLHIFQLSILKWSFALVSSRGCWRVASCFRSCHREIPSTEWVTSLEVLGGQLCFMVNHDVWWH